MKITDIEQQKHNKNRYSIYIDNNFAFGLEAVDVLSFRLKVDDEISPEKYNIIMEQGIFSKAKDKAIKFLSFKARSEFELRKKLLEEEYPQEIIEKTVAFLKSYGYIDDESYAKAYIKERFNLQGYGLHRLSYELKRKGIKDEIIATVTAELNDANLIDENNMAVELLKKKLRGEKNIDNKVKQRLYGFLARKGYNYSVIKYAFNEVLQEDFE